MSKNFCPECDRTLIVDTDHRLVCPKCHRDYGAARKFEVRLTRTETRHLTIEVAAADVAAARQDALNHAGGLDFFDGTTPGEPTYAADEINEVNNGT